MFLVSPYLSPAQQPNAGYITHNYTPTVSKTSLDGGSIRRRDLYLTTHNTQTSKPSVGF